MLDTDRMSLLDPPGEHVAAADITDFALLYQSGEGFERFFEWGRAVICMSIIQVDMIGLEAL